MMRQQLERRQTSTLLAPLELEAFATEAGQQPPPHAPAFEDAATAPPPPQAGGGKKRISPWLLAGIVASMTILGTVLTVVTKLMTIPMANYPITLTFETVFAVRGTSCGWRDGGREGPTTGTARLDPSTTSSACTHVKQYVPISLLYILIRWCMGTLDPASLRYPWKVHYCIIQPSPILSGVYICRGELERPPL